MIPFSSLDDLSLLRESVSLECKLANGRDGNGALPNDFCSTYSATANTDGGVVVLGMRESKGHFEPVVIENADKVRTELFNNLNNRQKVSLKPVSMRNDYLTPMDRSGTLSLAFPTTPIHERQAYCATDTLPRASDAES